MNIPQSTKKVELKKKNNIANPFDKFERLTNNQTFAIVFGGLLLLSMVYLIFLKTGIDLNNFTSERVQEVTQVSEEKKVNSLVVKGTNYSEEGFSIIIPRGNSSSCIWTWVGGTGDIPGSKTTNSTSGEANLHKLVTNLFNGKDFKVGCTNDYGEYYQGTFKEESSD